MYLEPPSYFFFQTAYLGSIALSFPIVSDFLLAYYPGVENIAALKDLNAIKEDIKINKIYDNSPIMKLQELIYKQIQKSLHFTIADEILNKLPEVTFARFVSRSQTIATAFLHVPLSGFIKLNDQEFEDNLLLTIGLPPVMGNLCAICNSSLGSSYEDHSVSKCSKYTHKRYGSMLEWVFQKFLKTLARMKSYLRTYLNGQARTLTSPNTEVT